MEILLDKKEHLIHLTPRFQYHFRLFINLLTVFVLIANDMLKEGSIGITTGIASSLLIAYGLLGYWIDLKKTDLSHYLSSWLPTVDGLVIFLSLAIIDYPIWSSLLLAGSLNLIAILHGGINRWVKMTLGILLGFVCGFFWLSSGNIDTEHYPNIDTITLLAVLAFLCLQAYYSHKYQTYMDDTSDKLQKESDQQRLYAYKLSRYLPNTVTNSLLNGRDLQIKTERKRITVFFSDIVGFTELSEELEAETLTELLNSYLSEMSTIANQFGGTVDKFMGDAVMVLFGDDEASSKGVKRDAVQCTLMALAMKQRMQALQASWLEMGIKKPLQIRIGINTGYCTVGTFGTSKSLDYTALGAHVNLASRLESAGKPGEILVSYETWSVIKDIIMCRDKGQIKAKGFSHAVQVYEVMGSRKELAGNQLYLSESLEGFSMHLDMQKLKNYDKDKVVAYLEKAAKNLRDKQIH